MQNKKLINLFSKLEKKYPIKQTELAPPKQEETNDGLGRRSFIQ
jgi:hypothetical protein